MSEESCVFCRIVRGELPCFKLHEDETTLAFMDINPASEGHCLVVPKAHHADLMATPPELVGAAAVVARRLAVAVQQVVAPDGLNLVQSNGPGAAQSVRHFHVHVLPRRSGDGLLLNWGLRPGDRERIGDLAERIRAAL